MNKKIVIGGIAALVAGYITAFFIRQKQLIDKIELIPKRYKILSTSADEIKVAITSDLVNPTRFGFSIFSQNYKININSEHIADIDDNGAMIYIPKNSKTELTLVLTINPKDAIKKGLSQLIITGKNTEWQITGSMGVSTAGIVFNKIPIEFKGKISKQ